MRPVGDLLHRLFDHLSHHCASSTTTDREAVERRERIGVEPNTQHRSVRNWICRHQTCPRATRAMRSEEHTSELQSLMRISYAVFCLKQTKTMSVATRTA